MIVLDSSLISSLIDHMVSNIGGFINEFLLYRNIANLFVVILCKNMIWSIGKFVST